MSSKFVKKLRKDLKKSPGKAAALAGLLAVAAWFWSPLLKDLFGGSATPAPAEATANSANASETATAPTPVQPQYHWKLVADAIDHDPRMLPAEPIILPRDPFRKFVPEKPKDEQEAKPVAPPPVVLDVAPGDAGLVLSSTLVGPVRRVARINGKTYREGDVIEATMADKLLQYKVVTVDGRSVVLALGTKQYELKMTRPQAGAGKAAVSVSSDSPNFDPSLLEQPE